LIFHGSQIFQGKIEILNEGWEAENFKRKFSASQPGKLKKQSEKFTHFSQQWWIIFSTWTLLWENRIIFIHATLSGSQLGFRSFETQPEG
jgi:hypothetical protein